jgi:hypothetical protein
MCLELPVLSLIEVLISELKISRSSLFFQRLVLIACRITCAERLVLSAVEVPVLSLSKQVEVSGLCSLTGQY